MGCHLGLGMRIFWIPVQRSTRINQVSEFYYVQTLTGSHEVLTQRYMTVIYNRKVRRIQLTIMY